MSAVDPTSAAVGRVDRVASGQAPECKGISLKVTIRPSMARDRWFDPRHMGSYFRADQVLQCDIDGRFQVQSVKVRLAYVRVAPFSR